jgi:DNA processing protein
LLEEHGTAQNALAHLPEVARAAGVNDYMPCREEHAISELRRGEKVSAQIIFRGTAEYPTAFNDLNDAPPFFWAVGDVKLLHRPTLGLVGARNASSLGTRMSRFLASALGEEGLLFVRALPAGWIQPHMPLQSAQAQLLFWAVGSMLYTPLKMRN